MSVRDYPSQAPYGRVGYVVLHNEAEEPGTYLVVRDCPWCGLESRTVVSAQGLWDWEHGTFVQTAFPDLSAGEREQLITGTHPACWDVMVPDDEEEE